jgi:hypothetical protein
MGQESIGQALGLALAYVGYLSVFFWAASSLMDGLDGAAGFRGQSPILMRFVLGAELFVVAGAPFLFMQSKAVPIAMIATILTILLLLPRRNRELPH